MLLCPWAALPQQCNWGIFKYVLILIVGDEEIFIVHAWDVDTAIETLSEVKYLSELISQRLFIQFPKQYSALSYSSSSCLFFNPQTVFDLLIDSWIVPGPLKNSGVSDTP